MNLFSWRYAVGMTSLLAMTPVITSNPALAQAQNTNSTNPVAQSTMTVQVGSSGKKISPDLFGIFFEDLNYAADGGLYAELIQNRSFEYSKDDNQGDWNALTSWELVERGGAKGSVAVKTDQALHPNNPQYALLTVTQGGAGAGLINAGFDGIPVKAGEKYNFSCFARRVDGMPIPIELNRWYDLKVVISGSRIQCFVDGKLIHDVTDDAKPSANTFVASAVRDTKSGDTILKLVNVSPYAVRSEIQLSGLGKGTYPASKTVLAGEPGQTNSFSDPKLLVPQVSSVSVKNQFQYEAQPHSFTVFRIKNAS